MDEERKRKERERKRRARRQAGAQPRAGYLASAAKADKPWIALGTSRRTYYRRKACGTGSVRTPQSQNGTGSVRIPQDGGTGSVRTVVKYNTPDTPTATSHDTTLRDGHSGTNDAPSSAKPKHVSTKREGEMVAARVTDMVPEKLTWFRKKPCSECDREFEVWGNSQRLTCSDACEHMRKERRRVQRMLMRNADTSPTLH
jgi:hypothetical protein